MGRRMSSRGREAPAILGILLLVFMLTGCGGTDLREASEGEDGSVPSSPQEAGNVVVRVSGAQGTAYSGNYGTLAGGLQIVEDTLGDEPQEYAVQIEGGRPDGVSASFRKSEAGTGELKAQIVADREVVVESSTRVPNGSVIVDWIPETSFQEEGEIQQ